MFRRAVSWLLALAILVTGVGGFVYLRATRPVVAAVNPPERLWRVQVTPARFERLAPEVVLYATVEAPRRAALTAAVMGDVVQVTVNEGDSVRPGQLLVQLDPTDQQFVLDQRNADLQDAEAALQAWTVRRRRDETALQLERELLDLLTQEVTRLQALRGRDLTAQTAVDTAQQSRTRQALTVNQRTQAVETAVAEGEQLRARRNRAQTARDQATLDLQRTRIVAPFAGQIQRVNVAPGDRIRVGEPLLTLFSPTELVLRGRLPQTHLAILEKTLANGLGVMAYTDIDGTLTTFTLDRLSADQGAGGVDGLFRPREPVVGLRPGRIFALTLVLPAVDDLLSLPYAALYGLDHVYVVRDGRLLGVPVQRMGEHRPDPSEIVSRVLVRSDELRPDDPIVITQLPNAVTGLRVEALVDGDIAP